MPFYPTTKTPYGPLFLCLPNDPDVLGYVTSNIAGEVVTFYFAGVLTEDPKETDQTIMMLAVRSLVRAYFHTTFGLHTAIATSPVSEPVYL